MRWRGGQGFLVYRLAMIGEGNPHRRELNGTEGAAWLSGDRKGRDGVNPSST